MLNLPNLPRLYNRHQSRVTEIEKCQNKAFEPTFILVSLHESTEIVVLDPVGRFLLDICKIMFFNPYP